eukprot:3567451-Alexandrium_andersonii.AAC.1
MPSLASRKLRPSNRVGTALRAHCESLRALAMLSAMGTAVTPRLMLRRRLMTGAQRHPQALGRTIQSTVAPCLARRCSVARPWGG